MRLKNAQILELLKSRERGAENYLLDETIVYLLRDSNIDNDFRETLYAELNRRLWKLLKKFAKNFNNQADFEDFGQKIELAILRKIFDYSTNSADYAEVNFGDFVVKTAKVVWRGELVKINKDKDLFYMRRENEDDDYADSIENNLESGDALADYTLMLKEGFEPFAPRTL